MAAIFVPRRQSDENHAAILLDKMSFIRYTDSRDVRHYSVNGRDIFEEWLDGLNDVSGRIAIWKRIDRVKDGNFGDHRYVGGGVWEMRVHFGPGYRVYYGEDGPQIVLLLCGGDKSTQYSDIRKAQQLWAQYMGVK